MNLSFNSTFITSKRVWCNEHTRFLFRYVITCIAMYCYAFPRVAIRIVTHHRALPRIFTLCHELPRIARIATYYHAHNESSKDIYCLAIALYFRVYTYCTPRATACKG